MHVTVCEHLVFHEFRWNLYITFANYLGQESIAGVFFSWSLNTFCSSKEEISWDESSGLYDISDMFSIAPCLADLSDILFQ